MTKLQSPPSAEIKSHNRNAIIYHHWALAVYALGTVLGALRGSLRVSAQAPY